MSDLQDHAPDGDNLDRITSEQQQQQPTDERIARWSRRVSMMSAADLESMEQHFSQIEITRNQTECAQVSSISNLSMKARLPKPLKTRAEYPAWMKQMKICLKNFRPGTCYRKRTTFGEPSSKQSRFKHIEHLGIFPNGGSIG